MTNQSKLGVPKNDGKKLVKDIMIYGVSSIVGRFLNYLLVPLYSYKMPVESGSYGVVSNMYALIALLLVILTYGMETGFFYYANKQKENPYFLRIFLIFYCLFQFANINIFHHKLVRKP